MKRPAAESKAAAPPRRGGSLAADPRFRAFVVQAILLIAIVWIGWTLFENIRQNLAAQKIASGFGFFGETAGFGISQTLIPYTEESTYGRAFFVGLVNTLIVSALAIVFATILGFAVGIARLSRNVLLARLAEAYVEVLRNLPLLFQILFWYLAVLGTLPGPRQSTPLLGAVYLTNRGIIFPKIGLEPGSGIVFGALGIGFLLALILRFLQRRQMLMGSERRSFGWLTLLLIVGLPALAFVLTGAPVSLKWPELRGFNFVGGARLNPELLALLFALSTYTASFIAEIVRAGVLAVPRGQTEAAFSLGLSRRTTLRRVVAPQAMRLIVPPLTSQYLNITKNSSLAAAIGYPDFFYVFAGTTLNQTGQAIEIIAITMAVYLAISLATAIFMNWYNRAIALKGA
ncbi:MAG: amino acid ABC transporter permease [Bradyrhizobiaceae bacterium]|nr:amino acid ABC transporter permease [Bradyrhizobiaceae bacterium]